MSRALKIALFCSASEITESAILAAAREFCAGLKARGGELLYGGGRSGLMGYAADRALELGVVVRGATTEGLARSNEGLHPGIDETLIVKDLFERKRWFLHEADGFVIFPGGFGTLDEALEAITWKALGCHAKPIVFVNAAGFWQHQLKTFEEMVNSGAIRAGNLNLYAVVNTSAEAWTVFDAHISAG